MFSARISALTLSLASIGFVACSHAEEVTPHQMAVTMIAMEHLCNREYPDLKLNAENMVAADPKTKALKEEVRKVREDPANKPELEMITRAMSDPQMWDIAKASCKDYASK